MKCAIYIALSADFGVPLISAAPTARILLQEKELLPQIRRIEEILLKEASINSLVIFHGKS